MAYWKDEGGKLDLACERVIREGAYPTTETKLKEAKERTERDMEKLATALQAGISVKPKAGGQGEVLLTYIAIDQTHTSFKVLNKVLKFYNNHSKMILPVEFWNKLLKLITFQKLTKTSVRRLGVCCLFMTHASNRAVRMTS